MFRLAGSATIPAVLNGAFSTLRSALIATNTTLHGRSGIVFVLTRGPKRALNRAEPAAALLAHPGQTVRIRGNRLMVFAMGIRVAESSRANRKNPLFFDSVDFVDNQITLRLPWHARPARWQRARRPHQW